MNEAKKQQLRDGHKVITNDAELDVMLDSGPHPDEIVFSICTIPNPNPNPNPNRIGIDDQYIGWIPKEDRS